MTCEISNTDAIVVMASWSVCRADEEAAAGVFTIDGDVARTALRKYRRARVMATHGLVIVFLYRNVMFEVCL